MHFYIYISLFDRKVLFLIKKYFCFLEIQTRFLFYSLHKIAMNKQQRFILKLSLTYWGSVNQQQSVHYTLSTLFLGIGNTLVVFSTESISSFFKWVPNYILLPVKLKREGRASLDGESIDLSSKLSVTCGGNMNYYKSNQHPCNFQNKSVSSPFN